MVDIDVFYKFRLKKEPIDSLKNKPYYFISIENLNQLTRKKFEEILIEDGYNPKYLKPTNKYEYFFTTKEEFQELSDDKNKNILNNFRDLDDKTIEIESTKNQLYVHIIIDEKNEKEENEKEKHTEENDIKTQLSNIQQISNEIREINRQIFNLNQKKVINEEEKNSEGTSKSNLSKTTKTNQQSKKILYFILENEVYEKDNKEIKLKPQLNSNFYLTQKLKTLIPLNFDIKFKIFKGEEKFDDFFEKKNDLINICFLYLGSRRIKDEIFNYFGWDKNKDENENKVGIKILLLGYIENQENFTYELNKGIKNIIYIPKNENINFDEMDIYNQKTYYYYFIEFVHEFVSQLTSKCDYCPINEAFNKAKMNLVKKFKRIFKNKESLENYDLIKLQSRIEDDNFDNEVLDIYEILNNDKKIINDIYDEYEYEYNKIKNIYYRKNPFSEENKTYLKKRKYEKFMKLPGIESLRPKNFLCFVEKQIYNLIDNIPNLKDIIESIEKNNSVNIYGKENVFYLGDELCKYFYMQGNFPDGIYIVSPSFIEEEIKSFIKKMNVNERNNGKTKILILLKMLDINNKDFINAINKVINEKSSIEIQFIICSETQLFYPPTTIECIELKNEFEIKTNN